MLISTPVCAVSLLGGFPLGSFCLKIYENLLMACDLLAPMDTNGAVGSGFSIAFIKYTTALVSAY